VPGEHKWSRSAKKFQGARVSSGLARARALGRGAPAHFLQSFKTAF